MCTGLRVGLLLFFFFLLGLGLGTRAEEPVPLAAGVRGVVTKASAKVVIDGKMDEWTQAFCTPVAYNHHDLQNRAGQFFYLWDEDAFYIGLRCLDKKTFNGAPLDATYNGDAVEFYLDTRQGDTLRAKDWSTGAIHFFFSPFQGSEVKPRWVIRKGIATSGVVLSGVEIAATSDGTTYEVEFRLPWANFPDFKPEAGALLALDAELCSSDGKNRVDRTFAYGSPLSVQQPASLGKVQLVKSFDPDYMETVGPAAFPLWVETPWNQAERAQVQAVVAIPPEFIEIAGRVEVRIHDTEGRIVKTLPALLERFGPKEDGFERAVSRWSIDDFAPNRYFVTARILSRTDKTLVTVAPRMVHEAIISGR